ncbi:unnamed protein product [Microthlaspi erraticum]|uniref:Uncharacterized protein n=1 Tax=Microthlaspi erraticum TaxID=1685480 RepID=A0A6D2IZY2_9BRAS|nr:unnamed protein product [Microthlaspi erraticum]
MLDRYLEEKKAICSSPSRLKLVPSREAVVPPGLEVVFLSLEVVYVGLDVAVIDLEIVAEHIIIKKIADIFTKYFPVAIFTSLRYKLVVDVPPTPSLRGADKTLLQQNDTVAVNQNKTQAQQELRSKEIQIEPKMNPSELQQSPAMSRQKTEADIEKKRKEKPYKAEKTENAITTQNRFALLSMSCLG